MIAGARGLLDQELVPANRVAELDRAWAAVSDAGLAPELQAEFAALREQLGARMRARGEGEQALTVWLKAVDEAIDKLTASLPGVAQGSVPPDEVQALAAGLLELLAAARIRVTRAAARKPMRPTRVLALASSVVERAKFLQSLPAPGAADEAGEKLTIEQWRGFPEVSEGELHTVLASRFADWRNANAQERQLARDAHRAHERQQTAEQNQRHSSAVERDVEAAEAAQAEGHVADLARLLAAIDQALKRGPVNAALRQRIDSLRREHLRLRHWQRWGGGQRREELAAEAQELARAAAGKVSIQEHAAAITKLRERWKELDKLGGASKQAVWLTFDGALKTAYAPVAAHLEKLKLARDENLAARNRIVDGLIQAAAKLFPGAGAQDADNAPLPPGARATTDWRAIARTLEEAQIAWRKLGPVEHTVPRKALQGDKAVTTRYAAAVQALEAPLKNTYGEARRQREQLIAARRTWLDRMSPRVTSWTRCEGCRRSGKPLRRACRCRDVTRRRCGLRSRPPPMRYSLRGTPGAQRRKRNSAPGSRRAKRSSSAWPPFPPAALRPISSARWLKPIPRGVPARAPATAGSEAGRTLSCRARRRDEAPGRARSTRVASALRCAHREDGALPRARSGAGFGSRHHGRGSIGSGSPLERHRESPRSLERQAGSAFPGGAARRRARACPISC